MAVHPDAPAAGGVVILDQPGAGCEIVIGVFGVDAALDGVAPLLGFPDVFGKHAAGGNADLLLDQVHAVDFLGDGMLHLDAGVHLHEVEILLLVHQILDGAGVDVFDLLAELHRGVAHAFAELFADEGGRALLDDLLIAALQGAVAFAEGDDVAFGIAEDLDFDVVGIQDQLLHVHVAVAEAFFGFITGRGEGTSHGGFIVDGSHAATAPAIGGFEHDRVTHGGGGHEGFLFILEDAVGAGRDRHFPLLGGGPGAVFVAHRLNGLGTGADELDFAAFADAGETGVLAEKSVPGVDGVHIGDLRGRNDAVDHEITLIAGAGPDTDGVVGQLDVHGFFVGLGINGDRADAEFLAGADDAKGDLTAVGDQDFIKHETEGGRGKAAAWMSTADGSGIRPA